MGIIEQTFRSTKIPASTNLLLAKQNVAAGTKNLASTKFAAGTKINASKNIAQGTENSCWHKICCWHKKSC